ncbi:MAG: YdbL family protein [Spirochaetes bacterium]|nr:YdbL family protein [Spirochaetota bacterium]
MKHIVAIALAIVAGILYSQVRCSSSACLKGMPSCIEIHPPAIHITGEKTALERQLIGEYKEIEKDAWVTSTVMVPSKGERYAFISTDESLLQAIKIRELNLDRIRMYKDMGIIGEMNNGYVGIVDEKKLQSVKDSAAIRSVVNDENNARVIIFIKSSGSQDKNDPKAIRFGYDFAKEQHAKAKKGDWIQKEDGRWVKK